MTLNTDIFQGTANMLKGKLRQRYGELTDDDLTQLQGYYEQFVGFLQKKYGYTRAHAENETTRIWSDVKEQTDNLSQAVHQYRNQAQETMGQYRAQAQEQIATTVTKVDESGSNNWGKMTIIALITGFIAGIWFKSSLNDS
jgi:uncharacterized protein YjbJ (UPF0337 family)